MGSEFDASAKYIFHKSFVPSIGVGHFFPGEGRTSAKHGAPLTLAYLSLTDRFKVEHETGTSSCIAVPLCDPYISNPTSGAKDTWQSCP